MKRSLRMFGIRSAKILFALSLLISCLTFGQQNPTNQLAQLKGKSPEEQLATLEYWNNRGELSPSMAAKIDDIQQHLNAWSERPDIATYRKGWLKREMEECLAKLTVEARVSQSSVSPNNAVAIAKGIKRSPLYSDAGPQQTTNWLSNAFDRLNNIHPSCDCNRPVSVKPTTGVAGPWLIYVIYAIVIAALAAFIIFAISRFSWNKKLQRKSKALLDEDEPERSLDEWLEMADKLEREGRYREAVRCLYLACLLKIDQARIARFERSQTNWEHLARIEASPNLPPTLHFREPTKAFDLIWYGMRVNGSEDVTRFRAWYRDVLQAVRKEAA